MAAAYGYGMRRCCARRRFAECSLGFLLAQVPHAALGHKNGKLTGSRHQEKPADGEFHTFSPATRRANRARAFGA